MKTMKTAAAAVMAAMMVLMTGCEKELPTPEKMEAIATVIGKTAGYVCEIAKTKTEVKEGIDKVLDVVGKVVPAEGQTFVEAWTPVIDEELKKLVDAGKLDANGAAVAKIALGVACEGIDYVFVRYPKAKDVQELVSAATTGFINGYKSVVKLSANAAKPEIDEEAYKYLKAKFEASK